MSDKDPEISQFETHSTLSSAVMPGDISPDLRYVLDRLPDGVVFLDREWRFTYANEQARRISRIRPEQLNSLSHWEIYPTTVGTEQETKYRRVMDEGTTEELEFYYEPFDIWFHLKVFPIHSGIAVYYQDVTAIRRMQQAQASTTRQLQQVFEVTTDAVVSLNHEWRYTYLNPRAKELLGVGDDMIGEVIWHRFPEAVYSGSPYVEHYYRAMNQRVASTFEAFYPEPLNKWLRLECQPSEDGIVVFFRDITRTRNDQEALRRSEERFRILTEHSPQAIWTATPDGRVDYSNRAFLTYLGPEFEVQAGNDWLNAFAPQDHERVSAAWTHALQTGEDYSVAARIICVRDGAERWWQVDASAARDEDGNIIAWLGVAIDIHDQHVATEALEAEKAETERQRAELEAVYQTAPVGLALFETKEFRYLRVNDRQSEVLGKQPSEIIGHKVSDIVVTPVISEIFRSRVMKGESVRDYFYDTEMFSRPGELRSFNVNYSPIFDEAGNVRAISAAVLEITQLRKAERALLQSEKLAAVGRLASSISHEINNPLEAVTNLLYLAALDDTPQDEVKQYVHQAQDELVRVSQIATQTLRFHRQSNKPTLVTPAQLVDAVLNLFAGRLANSRIHVEASYSTASKMLCFENDIRQVLNNLIANAIDAMRTGGRLLVRAHDALHHDHGTPGVRIIVADTGTGMTAETQQRLFEPFYTTKDLNGTGLGLWISQEIVERHKGELKVRSSQRPELHGTVFSLFLPLEWPGGSATDLPSHLR